VLTINKKTMYFNQKKLFKVKKYFLYIVFYDIRKDADYDWIRVQDHIVIIDSPETYNNPQHHCDKNESIAKLLKKGESILLLTGSDWVLQDINFRIMLNNLDPTCIDLPPAAEYYQQNTGINHKKVRAFNLVGDNIEEIKVDKYGCNNKFIDEFIATTNSIGDELYDTLRETVKWKKNANN